MRTHPSLYGAAFLVGILPDIPPIGFMVYKIGIKRSWRLLDNTKKWSDADVPNSVYHLYDITHSLITTIFIFIILYLVHKEFAILALAYGLHILCDIPFHDSRFSTRFLYPISNFHIHGFTQRKHRWVLWIQYPIIVVIYFLLLQH